MEQTGGLAGLGGISSNSWIDDLYQNYFGREADAGGRDFWLNSGLGQDDIGAQFATSPEAQAYQQMQYAPPPSVQGNPLEDYIRSLYSNVLGRDADQEGLNFWLNSGADQYSIYDAFDATPDAQRYDISQMYRDYFGREADQEGLDYWSASGADDETIQRAFYDTPEAQAYFASQQQMGPYQSWMKPLTPKEGRSDLETMAEIYRAYRGDEYAAGMLSNQYTEGRNNATQMQGPANGQPYYKYGAPLGYGVNQLDYRRQADLFKFAEQFGLDPHSADGQARFHIWEAENTEKGSFRKAQRNDGSAAGWSRGISEHFIRPGKANLPDRLREAPEILDWIKKGMSVEDPRFRKWTTPFGPMPNPVEPEFLPGYGGEKYDENYVDPSFQSGSSYQGQSIDPVTGQWVDPSAYNFGWLQPAQQQSLQPLGTNSLDQYGWQPSHTFDQRSDPFAYQAASYTPFGTPAGGVGGEPGGNFPNALDNGAFGNSGYSSTPNEPFYVPLTIPGGGWS